MNLPSLKSLISSPPEDDVEVRIRGLMMDPNTRSPIVVLNDMTGDLVLPIWVGLHEAHAIAMEIEKATTPRPMTHDLLHNVIDGLNARVMRVVVGSLEENTFHATIWMQQEMGGTAEVVALDARPSDAIALALRADCPIFVSRQVIARVKDGSGESQSQPEAQRRWLENLNDDEMGPYKM